MRRRLCRRDRALLSRVQLTPDKQIDWERIPAADLSLAQLARIAYLLNLTSNDPDPTIPPAPQPTRTRLLGFTRRRPK